MSETAIATVARQLVLARDKALLTRREEQAC
jgi:hypothetical protein